MKKKWMICGLLAGVLSAGGVSGDENGPRAEAEAAIADAQALLDQVRQETEAEYPPGNRPESEAEAREEALEHLQEAEGELRGARNRFDSGNYDGALDHARSALSLLQE